MNAASLNALRHPIMDFIWEKYDPYTSSPETWPADVTEICALDDELASITYQLGLGTSNPVVADKVKKFVWLTEPMYVGMPMKARIAWEKLNAAA